MSKSELWDAPAIVPSLAYEDVPDAIEWLTQVFGSYCQIWCMRKKLGGFPAELSFVYSIDELHAVDDVRKLLEAA